MTLENFYRICDNIEPDEYGCLPYPGATRGFHFRVIIEGQVRRVNRLVLERKLSRPIRPGFHALHTCDYPSCVNEDHLYEGTDKDNARDRMLRNPDSVEHMKRMSKTGREAIKGRYREDPEFRAKTQISRGNALRKQHQDPVFRAKVQANLAKGREAARKKYQEDPEFRAKMLANLAKGWGKKDE
jgi:hypothetical protein